MEGNLSYLNAMIDDKQTTATLDESSHLVGIIPRTIEKLFDTMNARNIGEYSIAVSYFEICSLYPQILMFMLLFSKDCERIRDLLNPSQDNLKLREICGYGGSGGDGASVSLGFVVQVNDSHSVTGGWHVKSS